jgi:tripartite-type tricarboxylate transporter receptor subunit TctC
MRSIRAFYAALAGVAAIAVGTAAMAQEWPTRLIVVVSPFGAGTTYDFIARTVLDQVGSQIGQSFVLENRPGGGGTVGVVSVVRADPDGYTFLLSSSSTSAAVILHKSLPYDALRDLEPVAIQGIWNAAQFILGTGMQNRTCPATWSICQKKPDWASSLPGPPRGPPRA